MISRYIAIHKRKHIAKTPVLVEAVDTRSVMMYWVRLDFDNDKDVSLPETDGKGLRFNLNVPLTDEERNSSGIVKTLADGSFSSIVSSLQKLRDGKSAEISHAHSEAIRYGYFHSEALGIDVDCRRNDEKNDLQNVQGLIDDYESLQDEEKYYKGYTETTSFMLTLTQLESLKKEMIRHVRELYVRKWQLVSSLETAGPDEIPSITW